jgi:hypothetical protein
MLLIGKKLKKDMNRIMVIKMYSSNSNEYLGRYGDRYRTGHSLFSNSSIFGYSVDNSFTPKEFYNPMITFESASAAINIARWLRK